MISPKFRLLFLVAVVAFGFYYILYLSELEMERAIRLLLLFVTSFTISSSVMNVANISTKCV